MEVKRQLDVLDRHLSDSEYIAGDAYSIADIAIWPWYGRVVTGDAYGASEFLSADSYTHLIRWARQIDERPAVQRGVMVNRLNGPLEGQLRSEENTSELQSLMRISYAVFCLKKKN